MAGIASSNLVSKDWVNIGYKIDQSSAEEFVHSSQPLVEICLHRETDNNNNKYSFLVAACSKVILSKSNRQTH